MIGRTNTGGGSGGGLNFRVVGGTVAPSNPKENDIWINTDHKITEWIVDAVNPFESSEEIFTSDGSIIGYYLDQHGTEIFSDVNVWICTKNLSLPNGAKNVTITAGSTATTSVCHCFYDEDGNFISSVKRSTGKQVYDVPNGARSIRVSIRSGDTRSVMVKCIFANDGEVWISTGMNSKVKLNALKKNGIQVYPLRAKQYVGDAFVDVVAMSYRNGKWVDWLTYLYKDGDKCTQVTGGWTTYGNYTSVTYNSDSVTIQATSANATASLTTTNKIDVTDIDMLYFYIDKRTSGNYSARTAAVGICTSRDIANNGFVASTSVQTSKEAALYKVDVSNYPGSYYVGLFEVRANDGLMQCSEVYF